jgi:hypothetical protein
MKHIMPLWKRIKNEILRKGTMLTQKKASV